MIQINKNKCISCLACVSACPFGVIDMEGLFIDVKNSVKCTNCEKITCKILCPTGAIDLK